LKERDVDLRVYVEMAPVNRNILQLNGGLPVASGKPGWL